MEKCFTFWEDDSMEELIEEIKSCNVCSSFFVHNPRPVVQFSPTSKLLIIGQAPGRKVHESGVPWDDASGKNLRKWLEIEEKVFYDESKVALIPMGFCFPGSGKSGDLPPRPECAPLWHSKVLAECKEVKLTLLIGQYAQRYYLKRAASNPNLTSIVKSYKSYLPEFFPLPHPSPRNRIWMKKNPWFEIETIPALQKITANLNL